MDKQSVLVFGLGFLQKSLIEQCKKNGLFTVGVDIYSDAACKNDVDAFEIAAGDDFEATLEIAKKYDISGVVTAATDKPIVMMARIAEKLGLPFYRVKTAEWSTDKLEMKQRFQQYNIPCAKGIELNSSDALDSIEWNYPVIVKPRDNSGSRGVVFCKNRKEASKAISEAFEYTHKNTVLVEEFVEGQEYSIESLHYHGKTYVIQFTQKVTTEFPYNVELGHIQPASLTDKEKDDIRFVVGRVAEALKFDNCASHTELKINDNGIIIIETSPRLGGDFITSILTPLSTGVNLESLLVRMSIGEEISDKEFYPIQNMSSGVTFFELHEGIITDINDIEKIQKIDGCKAFEFDKKTGDTIEKITNSIDRYGYAIFQANSREQIVSSLKKANKIINDEVSVEF